MTELVVNVSKIIRAPIGKVFDAWLNGTMLAKFMRPMEGMLESGVVTSAKQGGEFTITMVAGDKELPHTGRYLEIDRPNKLVFTWVSHASVDDSTVTLNFTALNEDETQLELSHVKFTDEQTRSNHEGGWTNILNKLDEVLV